jgi:hypothetical protein
VTDAERDAQRERQFADRAGSRAIHERDGDLPLRVLVLTEALPLSEVTGFRMVSALANRASELRVTVAAASAEEAEVVALASKGVEVIVDPDPAWIGDRSMHATVLVVLGPAAAARFASVAVDRQPQAAVVYDPSGATLEDHLAARAAEAPVVRAADVVLAPVRGYEAFVKALAPRAVTVPSAPGTPDLDRSLAQALATCGVALPDAALA